MNKSWTIKAVLDKGIDAIGDEVERLAQFCGIEGVVQGGQGTTRQPGLKLAQARALTAYLRAACIMAREEREALDPKKGLKPVAPGELVQAIVDQCRADPEMRKAVLDGLRSAPRSS